MLSAGETAPALTLCDQDGAAVHALDFTLLADPEHAVADGYGTWVEKRMHGKRYHGAQRATFLIDPRGVIARVFPKVSPKTHDEAVLGALEEIGAPETG